MLPFQRDHPLPAAIELAVPLRAEGEQTAVDIAIGQIVKLVAAGNPQLVGQRWVEGDVVPEAEILPRCRQLGFRTIAMTLGIDPVARPVGPYPRPHIGGKTQAKTHAARLTG